MNKALVLGKGNTMVRRVYTPDQKEDFSDVEVTSIDVDPNCNPTIVMDLNGLGSRSLRHPFGKKLPFKDNTFDEMHAYNVLEHLGTQGDWRGYFKEFEEYHRVLKDGGLFYIVVPLAEDRFADPGHIRFFGGNHFGFLNQKTYEKNIEQKTEMTDYRFIWKKNFEIAVMNASADGAHLAVVLVKS